MTKELKEIIHDYGNVGGDVTEYIRLIRRKALKHEAQYLPSIKKLHSIEEEFKPVSELETLEALIEYEYLTLICLHHRRVYYRGSYRHGCPELPDYLYDTLEARVEALRDILPKDLIPSRNILLDTAGY